MNAVNSLRHFLPELFLLTGAFFVLFMDLVSRNKKMLPYLGILVLGLTLLLTKTPFQPAGLFDGFFTLDILTYVLRFILLGSAAVTLLIAADDMDLPSKYQGEFVALILFMSFALVLMTASTNLLMIFMSVEFVSLLSYILTGFLKKNVRSKEAALKYLLYGSVASAMMLYGFSLLYGMSGSLELTKISQAIGANPAFKPLALIAMILSVTGLGFKISMAPFHMWAPDVYEAAPTPVSGFLTVAPKAAGMILLARVLVSAFSSVVDQWVFLITALSILTMTLGNLTAIAQSNVKRLLAFSSIAQAGYILMGLLVMNRLGIMSLQIYLAAYALTNLGAFAVVAAVSRHTRSDELITYSGLSKKSPFLAAAMTLFLLSLTGLPPLAGFIAKFLIFSAVMDKGMIALAVVAALNSAVAAFYYFKIIRAMYLTPPNTCEESAMTIPLSLKVGLCGLLISILGLGLFPNSILFFFVRHF